MKRIRILRTFMFAILLGTIVSVVSSCSDDDESTKFDYGTVTGIVTDENDMPISDVTVTVSDVEGSVTTGTDGKYTFQNVPMDKRAITFTKKDYLTTSATVLVSKFDANKTASLSIKMLDASAKVMGTVTDAKNNGAPLAGVTITLGAMTTTSDSDGKYIFESLIADDYTIVFSKNDYVTVTKAVKRIDFVDKIVTLNIRLGGEELLPGLTADDLKDAEKWYYNEYRGGGDGEGSAHWDWSTAYMCALDFRGAWQEQNEGTTLQIRNNGDEQKNPASLNVFDSFVYGSKKITADNKILSLRLRTHNASAASPAYFGVRVIDLSAAKPTAVTIGETKTLASSAYTDFDFDLSAYVGKEVIISVGLYRAETGDYWRQLVIRAIRFANTKVTGLDWLPGTPVVGLEGWQLTQEMVRSTMVNPRKSYTGVSPIAGGKNERQALYRSWRGIGHVVIDWTLVPLKKDPEVNPSEGYLIKTRSTTDVSTTVPEAYVYSKQAISSGSNQLTFKTRTFKSGSVPNRSTFFKLTVIKDDGSVAHVTPISAVANSSSAAPDGCWKFEHYDGTAADPSKYATFVYDLSQFNGEDVVLVFGVYNGVASTSENKLCFYSINLQ